MDNKYTTKINTDNKFITYNRSKDGALANKDGDKDIVNTIVFDNKKPLENYFILMNRADGGYTAKTIQEIIDEEGYDYDVLADLYRNALAFQIKDDGRVGYKFMVKDCESETGYSIKEEWSYPGLVDKNDWSMISVRVIPVTKYSDEYFNYDDRLDYMRLAFYVNGQLVLWSKILPTLLLRSLNDDYEKQEGVPYNISLGGGSQGLADVIYNIDDIPEDHLFIEKEFGGSFIGLMKLFRFHACDLNYQKIKHNYLYEVNNDDNKEDMQLKIYYGTFTFDGLSSHHPITEEEIRSLKTAPIDTKTINLPIPVGARRVVIAVPDKLGVVKAILDVNMMRTNIKNSFENSTLTKKGYYMTIPGIPEKIKYNVYIIDYAFFNEMDNIYIINM